MVALIGPVREKVEEVCRSVSKDEYVASPANLNSPDQLVLSGHLDALREVVERLKGQGYKKAIFLNVSGPFHSPLMKPAAVKLKEELEPGRLLADGGAGCLERRRASRTGRAAKSSTSCSARCSRRSSGRAV